MKQQVPVENAGGTVDAGGGGTVWSAWHLHLGTSARSAHDRVLSDVISPVIDAFPDRPWFFLRYWQGGPHLRLRVGDVTPEESVHLRSRLEERLEEAGRLADGEEPLQPEEYAQSATRMAEGETGRNRFVDDLLSPGVYPAVYEPEVDRYGGAGLMPRTELLFQLSSELVRAMMPHAHSHTRRSIMALRATMSAAASLGGATEQAYYYAQGMRSWREWVSGSGYGDDQLDRLCRIGDDVAAVGRRFDPAEHGPFADWHRALCELGAEVRRRTSRHPGEIVSSHVHMFHNRLGLRMPEELRTYAWLSRLYPVPEGTEM